MTWFVRWFIRSSLFWLGVGVTLGVVMAFRPASYAYRPAHMHANLLGFVSMMIFGVAYHVIPRFNGRPLHRQTWAKAHFWLANAGLLLMVCGWIGRAHDHAPATLLLRTGAALSVAGVALFIVNLWITLGRRRVDLDTTAPAFHPTNRRS